MDRYICDTKLTDGVWRPVYETPEGRQYVVDDNVKPVFGVWYIPREERDATFADRPVIVEPDSPRADQRPARSRQGGLPGCLPAVAPAGARRARPRGAALCSTLGQPGGLPRPRPGRFSRATTNRSASGCRAADSRRALWRVFSGAVSHTRTVVSPEPDANVAPPLLKANDHT